MIYATDQWLDQLYRQADKNGPIKAATTGKEFLQAQEKALPALRLALGLDRIETLAEGFQLQSTWVETTCQGDIRIDRRDVTFLPGLTAPCYFLSKPTRKPAVPAGGPVQSDPSAAPAGGLTAESQAVCAEQTRAILYCHGHGNGCAETLNPAVPGYHKNLPLALAEQGYTVVVPEFVGFGEVVLEQFQQPDERGCYANTTHLLMYGITLVGLRVWQAMSCLDLIVTETKATGPIGVCGISGGGMVCSLLAALDSRAEATVISSYTNTFAQSILAMHHCIDNYIPGILHIGESPELIALAAPRKLMILSGDKDPIFPVAATKEAINRITRLYALLGQESQIHGVIFDGSHEMMVEPVLDWFNQVLDFPPGAAPGF